MVLAPVIKQSKDKFRTPSVLNVMALADGCLKTPVVIKTGGPGRQYVELKKTASWLCESATGKPYSKAPLRRSCLIDKFKIELKAGPVNERLGDKMVSMRDGEEQSAISTPTAQKRKARSVFTKGIKATSATKKDTAEFTKTITFVATVTRPLSQWRLWKKSACDNPWLHMHDVPAAVVWMHDEFMKHGVPKLEDEDDEEEHKEMVFWDRRDLAWQVKVKGQNSGMIHRQNFGVPRRGTDGQHLSPHEFTAKKEETHKQAMEWAEDHMMS